MNADLLRHLSAKFEEEQRIMAEDLSSGKARDFGEYKYATGVIRGLRIANNILLETAERMEKDND